MREAMTNTGRSVAMTKTWIIGLAAVSLLATAVGCAGVDEEVPGDEVALREQGADDLASGKADSEGCSGTVLQDRGFAKRLALTFDDGPNLTNTPQVLDILARHNAKATFFVNGKNLSSQASKSLVQRVQAAGHFVGNHSQNHLNLATVSATTLKSEIEKTHTILTGLNLGPKYFRFPFGSANCSAAATVRDYGYHVVGWHIDSADWCYAAGGGYCSPSTFRYVDNDLRHDITGYVVKQAKTLGGGVILFHDAHAYTVGMLDEILTRLEHEGFSFVALDNAEVFPKLNGVTVKTPWIGTVCKTDAECSFTANGVQGYCHDFQVAGNATTYGFCTLPCEGYCPDKSGAAPTFCTSLDQGASGMCVSKAGTLNGGCRDIPGTVQTGASRFIGDSTAPSATANVCLPTH
jgi:peptidoglycan-N-acetylglucosamine deacetylase